MFCTRRLLTYLNENLYHVIAQTLGKIGILGINEWIGFPILVLSALGVLNVRSVLLGFLLALAVSRFRMLFSRTGFVVLCGIAFLVLVLANSDWIGPFAHRLLYRDRDFLGSDVSNLTSGRTDIWPHYLDMISNFSFIELLFGRGAIWIHDGFELSAHNDALNLLVCYGVVGAAFVAFIWVTILSRMDPAFRVPHIVFFAVLFLTNGVIFHQSNILFLLFMAGRTSAAAVRRVSVWWTAAPPSLAPGYTIRPP
jgi:O-antigen ligase